MMAVLVSQVCQRSVGELIPYLRQAHTFIPEQTQTLPDTPIVQTTDPATCYRNPYRGLLMLYQGRTLLIELRVRELTERNSYS